MFWFVSKKRFEKEIDKIKSSFSDNNKDVQSLKVHLDRLNLDLDNKLSKLEERLSNRIDKILIEALKNKTIISSPISPIKEVSKTSLRQVQENKVIQAFRHTKKQIAKERIKALEQTQSIPSIKALLMKELGISKASFYNYLKELDIEQRIKDSPKVQEYN